ncbi:MAG: B12-binding domain-containing radical SAM protein [Candidatus Omnitrophica bacterium]|nr:B12-binding domain-containing radical SAM protein [Candidatus Omnitrophota bacterium]
MGIPLKKNHIYRILFVIQYTGEGNQGMMSLSSVLKRNGYTVEFVDASYNKIKKKLKDNIPTILAYHVVFMFADYYMILNKRLKKEFNVFSVFGGPHPTVFPEMIQEEGVDGVCIGEGEFAMLELIDNISSGKPIRNIKNWWIKENGHIFKNPLRPLIEDLDNLPFPDRDLFAHQTLFDAEKFHIITGRGCTFNCSYCYDTYLNKLYNNKESIIRRKSVQNVIGEIIQGLERFPVKFIMFDDDGIFISSVEWIKEFSTQYKQHVNLPFFCNVRADLVDGEIVGCLKEAGCFSVAMGIETADDIIREDFLNRKMTVEQIISAARLIKQHAIRLRTTNMVGIPGGTLKNDLETIKLNIKCKADGVGTYLFSTAYMRTCNPVTHDLKNMSDYKNLLTTASLASRDLVKNVRSLFSLTVEFPFLLYFLPILITLPLKRLYRLLDICWGGYCAYFRLYPTGIKTFFRGIRKYLKIITHWWVLP